MPGGDTQHAYRGFVAKHRLSDIPQAANLGGDLWVQFGVTSQPRWILVRADGTIERGSGTIPDNIVADALSPA
ncbi:hypothetical protein [Candidatus Poriferisodalis sp.]|uniref:hypothetical protein n=1 Tax=Candidatus Poriferisodalis sp. TaxID=3101277 RepID=UPI003B01ABFC